MKGLAVNRYQLIVNRYFLLSILLTIAYSLLTNTCKAQGDDNDNHYKGLLANRFDSLEKWSCHFQFTSIWQAHPSFQAKYSGINSLNRASESAMSITSTLYLGRKLWKNASFFFNPEISGGSGLSSTLGLAGAPNGETFRIGTVAPALYMARCFFEQHIALKKSNTEHRDGDQNQMADNIPASRITISVGKFSLADFFDDNAYSHDPRSEFMNWSLMDNGAWDYPANTRGYTWGAVVELITPGYAVRISSTLVPKIANSNVYDMNVTKANGNTVEFEKKYKIHNHKGNIRFLGYANFSSAPSYNTAINEMKKGDSSLIPIISGHQAGIQYGAVKYGFGISFNQELTNNIGVFARASWNDGQSATWAFTPIDQSASAGIRIKGDIIKRPEDNFGVAYVANGISAPHRAYMNAGGYDFMVGDGKLPNYGFEQILEAFYKVRLTKWLWTTADYQFVQNPGYNKDRGPVHIFAIRAHVEF
ncbi:MAG: carbohydrate porin [Bacteroidia bacterium]